MRNHACRVLYIPAAAVTIGRIYFQNYEPVTSSSATGKFLTFAIAISHQPLGTVQGNMFAV